MANKDFQKGFATGFASRGVVGEDYILPIGGDELGGVKNGGNVVINEDGTMTAPIPTGNAEKWEHICDIDFVTDEEVTVVTQDLGAEYRKLLLYVNKNSAGGLVSSGGDSYVLDIKDNNQIISRVSTNRNDGWSVHVFNIEWFQDISMFLSEHSDAGLSGKEGMSGFRKKPFTKLSFNTDGTHANGTVFTFGNFTMNIYGVRA